MQVNKHHTSDCTDFVLVKERVAYYNNKHSGIDETNIIQVVIAVKGETLPPIDSADGDWHFSSTESPQNDQIFEYLGKLKNKAKSS